MAAYPVAADCVLHVVRCECCLAKVSACRNALGKYSSRAAALLLLGAVWEAVQLVQHGY